MNSLSCRPVCFVEQANKPASQGGFAGVFLTEHHYSELITVSTKGFIDEKLKFVFLRNVLSPAGVKAADNILRRLNFDSVHQSHRTFLRRAHGGELVIGYLSAGATRPTLRFPRAYIGVILPLCLTFQQLMTEHWPAAAEEQQRLAVANGRWLIGSELCSFSNAVPVPYYSGCQVNHNVICPAHIDGKNRSGPSCLTAFGDWAGGALCFPRLRVAFPLQPGDVLIADTRDEIHGNVGPLSGTRISVVAYLRSIQGGGNSVR